MISQDSQLTNYLLLLTDITGRLQNFGFLELINLLEVCHRKKEYVKAVFVGDYLDEHFHLFNPDNSVTLELPSNKKIIDIILLYAICLSENYEYERALKCVTYMLEFFELSDSDIFLLGHHRQQILDKLDLSMQISLEDLSSNISDYLSYPEEIIKNIMLNMNNNANNIKIAFTITTCKRTKLFFSTINSFLHCCTDYSLINSWTCIDDNTDEIERAAMKRMYPFFEFIWKKLEEKGHPKSMNLIHQLAERYDYIFHCEDDWQFMYPNNYITKCLAILKSNDVYGQVLLNKNYGEISSHYKHAGGDRLNISFNNKKLYYHLHRHYPGGTKEHREYTSKLNGPAHTYWPHFSFRPGLVKCSVYKKIGNFNESSAHFEQEYAHRYTKEGLLTAFLPTIYCKHIGKLTSEKDGINAYSLNNEAQFTGHKRNNDDDKIKIKVLPFWCSSKEFTKVLNTQTKGNFTWNNLQLTSDDDVDYYVIWQSPGQNIPKEKDWMKKAIFFQTEPTSTTRPDLWGYWAKPQIEELLQVRYHDLYPFSNEWHTQRTYLEHYYGPKIIKTKLLSSIVTSKYFDPGHKLRIDFLKFFENKPDKPDIDIYSWDNHFKFVNHRGHLENYYNDPGLAPYKYCFRVENNSSDNFFTEKVVDTILHECLLFYWGCPNLEQLIPGDAFIRLPLDKSFEDSYNIIINSIQNNEWEKRLPIIKRAKQIILEEHSFIPLLERILLDLKLPMYVINLDRREDRWSYMKKLLSNQWNNYQRFPAIDGKQLHQKEDGSVWDSKRCVLDRQRRHLFANNDFGSRRSVIGCALSHIHLWQKLIQETQKQHNMFCILEDDSLLCDNFSELFNNLLNNLNFDFDLIFLGYHILKNKRTPNTNNKSPENIKLVKYTSDNPIFSWGTSYIGGLFGYLISKSGAHKLLGLINKYGIKHGIDYFMYKQFSELNVYFVLPGLIYSEYVDNNAVDTDIQNDHQSIIII